MNWGAPQIAMAIVGVAAFLAGLWFLLLWRPGKKPKALRLAEDARPQGLTEPTRLVISLVSLILGYHFIVWNFPPHTGVQLTRDLWYVWIPLGIAMIGISLLMDRHERGSNADRNEDR